MGTMTRRLQVLVALAVGCAFGSAATGCAFVFLGTARAADAVTVDCTSQDQMAEYTLPDTTPETFAGLTVVHTLSKDCKGTTSVQMTSEQPAAVNGKVSFGCGLPLDCAGHLAAPGLAAVHESYTFILR